VSNSQIENEIKNFVDTNEILIKNGRRFLAQKIVDIDPPKIKEAYTYLKEQKCTKDYTIFYFIEEIYIATLLQDWDTWKEYASNYKQMTNKAVYPRLEHMITILYNRVKDNSLLYLKSIEENPRLNNEDKAVLKLFFWVLENENPNEEYNKIYDQFLELYPNSIYIPFIKNSLPSKYFKSSLSWDVGAGYFIPSGNIKDVVESSLGGALAMDVTYNNLFFSLFARFAAPSLKEPLKATNEDGDMNFEKGYDFRFSSGGLGAGYFIARNDRFRIAPYLQISGASLKSNEYNDSKDKDKEAYMFDNFCYGFGIHSEMKIYEYDETIGDNPFSYSPQGYFSLKFDWGLNFYNSKDEIFDGNFQFMKLSLVWGMGDF
jgi:hypothetical protein